MKDNSPSMTVMSDDEIIMLFFERDEQAIRQTDLKYRNYLLSVAYNIVHDPEDSEECLNDTYIGVWNAIPPTRPKQLSAFLAAIMRRTAIDRYKAKTRQKRISSELTVALSEVEEFLSDEHSHNSAELGRIFSDFVLTLSEREMYIFMSRYYSSHPIKTIAKRVGCSVSTVNKELAEIRKKLKEKLKSEGYEI